MRWKPIKALWIFIEVVSSFFLPRICVSWYVCSNFEFVAKFFVTVPTCHWEKRWSINVKVLHDAFVAIFIYWSKRCYTTKGRWIGLRGGDVLRKRQKQMKKKLKKVFTKRKHYSRCLYLLARSNIHSIHAHYIHIHGLHFVPYTNAIASSD